MSKRGYYVALAGGVAVASGGSPLKAAQAACAALEAFYRVRGLRVERIEGLCVDVVSATERAAEVVRDDSEGLYPSRRVSVRADGVCDVVPVGATSVSCTMIGDYLASGVVPDSWPAPVRGTVH